jgi:hypothetical protein
MPEQMERVRFRKLKMFSITVTTRAHDGGSSKRVIASSMKRHHPY